jgi:hypothetical protein
MANSTSVLLYMPLDRQLDFPVFGLTVFPGGAINSAVVESFLIPCKVQCCSEWQDPDLTYSDPDHGLWHQTPT